MSKTESKHKKFIKFLLIKFPLILLVIAGILYVTLKLVERYPVPLREGFEQYLSGVSQSNVSIGTLEEFTFVPDINFDVKDVTFHRNSNAANIDATVERIQFSAPFLSKIMGQNKFKTIAVENLKATEESFFLKETNIETIEIIDREGPEQFGHFVVAKGRYNQKPLLAEASLAKEGDIYEMEAVTPFFVSLGKAKVEGNLVRGLREMRLENTVYSYDGKISPEGEFTLVEGRKYIKNNPLSCLMINGNGAKCLEFLEGKTEDVE